MHFTHPDKLTQIRRQNLSCWFSGHVQPALQGQKIHMEFRSKCLEYNQGATQQTSSGIVHCSYIKFGTPSLLFNSNCTQQQDHISWFPSIIPLIHARIHALRNDHELLNCWRDVHTSLDNSSVLHGTGKNPALQLLMADTQEITVNVGCSHTLMNASNK